MFKLKLNLLSLGLLFVLAPACRRGQSKVVSTQQVSSAAPAKSVAVFDDALDEFVIEEDESVFGPQDGFALIDEADNDFEVEQSRSGFMPIYFEYDKDAMKPAQTAALESNIARAKKLIGEGKKIVIEGHSCKFGGSPKHNLSLSEDRARAVQQYFVNHGIPAKKMAVVGRGNEMCVVPSGNKDQQAPNRRVEFVAVRAE